MVEGAHTIAAIILETVVGTNGILVPPDGYLAGVRDLCDEHGIVLIADEVMAGFGRCGEWFAVDHWGVRPDLITFAKGVNSGYVPLGGVIISDEIPATFDERPSPAGSPTPATRSPAPRPSPRSTSSRRRASSSTPGCSAPTSSAPAARDRRRSTRASATCAASACSGRSSWCATARRASRWCPTTPRARRPRRWTAFAGGLQAARALAVHALQPHPRRAAVHDDAGGGRARGSPSSTRRSPSPTSSPPDRTHTGGAFCRPAGSWWPAERHTSSVGRSA